MVGRLTLSNLPTTRAAAAINRMTLIDVRLAPTSGAKADIS